MAIFIDIPYIDFSAQIVAAVFFLVRWLATVCAVLFIEQMYRIKVRKLRIYDMSSMSGRNIVIIILRLHIIAKLWHNSSDRVCKRHIYRLATERNLRKSTQR